MRATVTHQAPHAAAATSRLPSRRQAIAVVGATGPRSPADGPPPPAPVGLALAALALMASLAGPVVGPAHAISGGGGDLSEANYKDLTGMSLAGKKLYKAQFRSTIFDKADLSGANMFGSFCEGASFVGANLRGTDLESVDCKDCNLTDAVLEGALVTNMQLVGRNLKIGGSDWTDVLLRKDVNKALCAIADGVNPTTGVATRDSLNCP